MHRYNFRLPCHIVPPAAGFAAQNFLAEDRLSPAEHRGSPVTVEQACLVEAVIPEPTSRRWRCGGCGRVLAQGGQWRHQPAHTGTRDGHFFLLMEVIRYMLTVSYRVAPLS